MLRIRNFRSHSDLLTVLPLVAFVLIATGFPDDAEAGRSRTGGSTQTDPSHHGSVAFPGVGRIFCTWEDFFGEWTGDPGNPTANPPILPTVVQEVAPKVCSNDNTQACAVDSDCGDGNTCSSPTSARCGGWEDNQLTVFKDPNDPDYSPPPFGEGRFHLRVKYTLFGSTCIDDPGNKGGGNNDPILCDRTDPQNPKHGGGGSSGGSSGVVCRDDHPVLGTASLEYTGFCENGVSVTGFLTLLPTTPINEIPEFTGPCGADRVAAGKCTLQLGGLPTVTTTKGKKTTTSVDPELCAAFFPEGPVPNAFGPDPVCSNDKTQVCTVDSDCGDGNTCVVRDLEEGQILRYVEEYPGNTCAQIVGVPDAPQAVPTLAYGAYCQSDIDEFKNDDNTPGVCSNDNALSCEQDADCGDGNTCDNNWFEDDPGVEGFDNVFRECPIFEPPDGSTPYVHAGTHEIETFGLAEDITLTQSSQSLNMGCQNADHFQVRITDQDQLLAGDVSLNPAPTLKPLGPFPVPDPETPNPARTTVWPRPHGSQAKPTRGAKSVRCWA